MAEDFITLTIGKTKNIALIAHDNMKHTLIEWCNENKDILKNHFLCGSSAFVGKMETYNACKV